MESLVNTRTIFNDDHCNEKAGQVELTKEFANKNDFEEWLKEEKNTINWSKRSKSSSQDKPKVKRPRMFLLK